MHIKVVLAIISCALILVRCTPKQEAKHMTKTATDKNGNQYEYVTNDPLGVKHYSLENGLKIYLSENKDEPRIQTLIAVRAGSKNDPKETTGLAHYLEHMVFKGTSKLGSLNWEKEKPLLEEIKTLYEEHKAEPDPKKKKAIYAKIDSVSNEAASHAAANEYDKVISSIGAKYTNAFTSNDQTVYINDIPANELEKWAKVEAERFNELVLRLFHTELETVYEEFNMGQDNDNRKVFFNLMAGLFPSHPYGTQTTIGEGEHLKNPSMVNIENFWNTYYRANNMAISLSGDFDAADAYLVIKENFALLRTNPEVKQPTFPAQPAITEPVEKEVFGPDAESVNLAFRFDGATSDHRPYLMLIDAMLNNRQAGLIDLNLVQKQKVLSAYTYSNFMADYSMFLLNARPVQGVSLADTRDLLLGEINKLKTGEYEDWLMPACLNNMKLNELIRRESNWRAFAMKDAFIWDTPWEEEVQLLDRVSAITKEQLTTFVNQHFATNYVAVYKRTGKDTSVLKVEKPEITAVPLNREQSAYQKEFLAMESKRLNPVFLDLKNDITETPLATGTKLYAIENKTSELSRVEFIYNIGTADNPEFAHALGFLKYMGSDSLSAEQVKQEFYKIGINMDVYTGEDRTYVYLYGLTENMEQGVQLLSHLMNNLKGDNEEAYLQYVSDIQKKREDAKLNKGSIRRMLYNYGVYGAKSPKTTQLSRAEMNEKSAAEMAIRLTKYAQTPQIAFYYGKAKTSEVSNWMTSYFPATLDESIFTKREFQEKEIENNTVYFVDHDMVQTDVFLLSKASAYDPKLEPMAQLFNTFYGSGLSSIIFQEIREAKGLAYTAYARYSTPKSANKSHYLSAFVGTQPDKLKDALSAMIDLMNKMPNAEKQFESAKESILKKLETDRIIKDQVFSYYLASEDKGLDYDIRKEVYQTVKKASMADMEQFFTQNIANRNYSFLVLGNKKDIDFNLLAELGEVKELTKEDIFGY